MKDLTVVWRNPNPHQCFRHWRTRKSEFSVGVYIVQELIPHGTTGRWASTAALELHKGRTPEESTDKISA